VLHTDPGLELVVGNGVTVGHKAMLHGCSIGDDSLIGIGSTVLNGAKIGRNSIVGAHALVTENKEFPDGVMLLGAPARIVRDLTEEEIALIRHSAEVYVGNAARFSSDLVPGV
jgi:carbonic anhydrase/acetyltransferase-like protein (isoleucine patch superfamily)